MKMEQVLHLGLMHVWAPVCGGGDEGFVRTKLFLKWLGGCWKLILVWWGILILCLGQIGECGI